MSVRKTMTGPLDWWASVFDAAAVIFVALIGGIMGLVGIVWKTHPSREEVRAWMDAMEEKVRGDDRRDHEALMATMRVEQKAIADVLAEKVMGQSLLVNQRFDAIEGKLEVVLGLLRAGGESRTR